jgi:CPA2 family monovalent cation:H+ antiporter-2
MLAWHALVLIGVPANRVLRRVRALRNERYELLRGFFPGASDAEDEAGESHGPRLHSVSLTPGCHAVGRTIADLRLENFKVKVSAVRRRGIRGIAPGPETRLQMGDVVVLMGLPEELAAAELRLLKGR